MEHLIVYKCPYPKRRIGRTGDGGYVTSVLPSDYDVLITGGISDDISFEQDFLNKYPNARCLAFDGTINALPTADPRITFIKKNLGMYETNETTNLSSYFESYNNIFFKIDIEGHEFNLLPSIFKYFHKIKQFVVEIHSPQEISLNPGYYSGIKDITNETMFSLLSNINKTHTLIHIHGNNGCGKHTIDGIMLPNVYECTYIRNDFIPYKIKNDVPFPTKLDWPNGETLPQYVLKGFPYSSLEPTPEIDYSGRLLNRRLPYAKLFRQ
jgi:hypothetical protein